ncbi:MAG: hypothetical protein R3A80_05060 [Bdellovibrionota bacterium]
MKLKAKDIIQDLINKEQTFFTDKNQSEIDIWMGIRFYVLSKIVAAKTHLQLPYEPAWKDIFSRGLAGFNSIFDLLGLRLVKSPKSVLFLMHERCTDGHDPYLSNIEKALPESLRSAKHLWLGDSRSLRSITNSQKNYYSVEAVKVLSKIGARFLYPFQPKKKAKDIILYLNDTPSPPAEKEYLIRQNELRIQKLIYRFLFQPSMNLSACFLSVSYCNQPLIQIIRDRFPQAKIVEAQHGLISKFHLGYATQLKSRKSFPDAIGLFGHDWESQLSMPIKTFVMGATSINIEAHSESRFTTLGTKNVLVVSQKSIAPLLKNAILCALTNKTKLNFIVKLHPAEFTQNVYEELVEFPEVILVRAEPLTKLLGQCEYIVGIYSTLVVEIAQAGYSVNILSRDGSEKMPKLEQAMRLINDLNEESLISKRAKHLPLNLFELPNYEEIKKFLTDEFNRGES